MLSHVTYKNRPAVILNGTYTVIVYKFYRGGQFVTMDGTQHEVSRWDLIIAHPPCTFLTVSGNGWFNIEKYGDKARKRYKDRNDAVKFFMAFVNADCERIAIENPIGYMNTHYRHADQIIQPYQFGYPARKATCLWLKGLPCLIPTKIVPYETECGNFSKGLSAAYARDENGKILRWNDPRTAKARSKTAPGIAQAMAEQWGCMPEYEVQLSLWGDAE